MCPAVPNLRGAGFAIPPWAWKGEALGTVLNTQTPRVAFCVCLAASHFPLHLSIYEIPNQNRYDIDSSTTCIKCSYFMSSEVMLHPYFLVF